MSRKLDCEFKKKKILANSELWDSLLLFPFWRHTVICWKQGGDELKWLLKEGGIFESSDISF